MVKQLELARQAALDEVTEKQAAATEARAAATRIALREKKAAAIRQFAIATAKAKAEAEAATLVGGDGSCSDAAGTGTCGSAGASQNTTDVSAEQARKEGRSRRAHQRLASQSERQRAVVAAFRHAWRGYRRCAWGRDDLLPLSCAGTDWMGLGLTIVDSLDGLLLLGLQDEFEEAKAWVVRELPGRLKRAGFVNTFETTIRVLGGLLSAHHLEQHGEWVSGDQAGLHPSDHGSDGLLLAVALDLAERLLPAFGSVSGVPYSDVNLGTGEVKDPEWASYASLAEATTLQLEFTYLATLTRRPDLYAAVERATDAITSMETLDGLAKSVYIDHHSSPPVYRAGEHVTLGARGDSHYEYMLKQWLLTDRSQPVLRERFDAAWEGAFHHLLRNSSGTEGRTFLGERKSGSFSPKMDHLVCFMPGVLALAAHADRKAVGAEHAAEARARLEGGGGEAALLPIAGRLAQTCMGMYVTSADGLAPEIAHFDFDGASETRVAGDGGRGDLFVRKADAHSLLRPETAESLFVLFRVTHDPLYQSWGWDIFSAIERHCRVEDGYASAKNVNEAQAKQNAPLRDKMESFFLGETLKYLYLLFGDDVSHDRVLPLDRFVFNTEAHPFPVLRGWRHPKRRA